MDIRRLTPSDIPALQKLLGSAPFESIAIRGLINYGNLAMLPWYGAFQKDELTGAGVLIPKQLALAWAREPKACEGIGNAFKGHALPCTTIGPIHHVQHLWNGWTNSAPNIIHQTTYIATEASPGDLVPGFRPAREDEALNIARLAGAGEEEETGKNTFSEQPDRLRALALSRIQAGHTWVIEDGGELVFQVHVAPVLPDCSQLVGTYVPPPHRGRGLSTAGVRGLLREMIPLNGPVVLRVANTNTPAIRCYRANGFNPLAPFGVLNP